jgi:hypothetical protein
MSTRTLDDQSNDSVEWPRVLSLSFPLVVIAMSTHAAYLNSANERFIVPPLMTVATRGFEAT